MTRLPTPHNPYPPSVEVKYGGHKGDCVLREIGCSSGPSKEWPREGKGGTRRREYVLSDEGTEAVRHELEAAGWEPEDLETDESIWRNPRDGKWYEEKRAIGILKGGDDAGESD